MNNGHHRNVRKFVAPIKYNRLQKSFKTKAIIGGISTLTGLGGTGAIAEERRRRRKKKLAIEVERSKVQAALNTFDNLVQRIK